MLTTVIAIYGAVIATASILFTAWSFWASGPRLQTEVRFLRCLLMPGQSDDGTRVLLVRVWNTGRLPVKFDISSIDAQFESGFAGAVTIVLSVHWRGPKLPTSIPANSGEEWRAFITRVPSHESTKIRITMVEGGHKVRKIEMPISQWKEVMEPQNIQFD